MTEEEMDIPMDQFETMMDEAYSQIRRPDLTAEEFIEVLRSVDEPEALYGDYDIEDIRNIPPEDRADFFQFFLGMIFAKMVDQEGGSQALDRAGIIRMSEDRSPKSWRKLFGKVPYFRPDFLGVFQTCLKTRIRPREALDELKRAPSLYQNMIAVVEAEGGPLPTPEEGIRRPITSTESIKMMGVALGIHVPLQHGFPNYYSDLLKEKGEDLDPEGAMNKFMTEFTPIMFFVLKMTGVLDRMIEGLADGRPMLRSLPGEQGRFEVTGDGRGIPWLM